MAKAAQTKEDQASTGGEDQRAGEAVLPGAGHPALSVKAPVLTPDGFRRIGHTLNGEYWQADIANLIGISRSQVTRYLKGNRTLGPLTPEYLQYVISQRIIALADLMHVDGMPFAGTREGEEISAALKAAAARAPGIEPHRPHTEPPRRKR